MFRTVAVVHIIRPQKTDDCWHMSSEQKARPQTSIAYFARSRKSIFSAIFNIAAEILYPLSGATP